MTKVENSTNRTVSILFNDSKANAEIAKRDACGCFWEMGSSGTKA